MAPSPPARDPPATGSFWSRWRLWWRHRPRTRRLLAVTGLAAICILGGALSQLWRFGAFTTIEADLPAANWLIPLAQGAEDLVIHHASGTVYLSLDDRREHRAGAGALVHLRREASGWRIAACTATVPDDFHPHGMGIHAAAGAETATLFVVNRRRRGPPTLERFHIDAAGTLRHRETLHHPLLAAANDVAVSGPRSCYVAIDGRSRSGVSRSLDALLARRSGRVLAFADGRWRVAVRDLAFANGIACDAHGRLLISESLAGSLAIYAPTAAGDFRREARIEIGLGGDNLHLDAAGRIWLTVQPDLVAAGRLQQDRRAQVPWRVLRLSDRAGGWRVQEVLAGDGSRLSGASAVLPLDDRMVVSSAFSASLLVCPVTPRAAR